MYWFTFSQKTVFFIHFGDVERNLGPFVGSKIIEISNKLMLYLALIVALSFDISLQNRYQDKSNFLHQLDLETIVLVTESWISGGKKLKYKIQCEHNFMHITWPHQTGAAKNGGERKWIRTKNNFKRRRDFELAVPFFICCGSPLAKKSPIPIKVSFCSYQSLGNFFLDKLGVEIYKALSVTDEIL